MISMKKNGMIFTITDSNSPFMLSPVSCVNLAPSGQNCPVTLTAVKNILGGMHYDSNGFGIATVTISVLDNSSGKKAVSVVEVLIVFVTKKSLAPIWQSVASVVESSSVGVKVGNLIPQDVHAGLKQTIVVVGNSGFEVREDYSVYTTKTVGSYVAASSLSFNVKVTNFPPNADSQLSKEFVLTVAVVHAPLIASLQVGLDLHPSGSELSIKEEKSVADVVLGT